MEVTAFLGDNMIKKQQGGIYDVAMVPLLLLFLNTDIFLLLLFADVLEIFVFGAGADVKICESGHVFGR